MAVTLLHYIKHYFDCISSKKFLDWSTCICWWHMSITDIELGLKCYKLLAYWEHCHPSTPVMLYLHLIMVVTGLRTIYSCRRTFSYLEGFHWSFQSFKKVMAQQMVNVMKTWYPQESFFLCWKHLSSTKTCEKT